MSMASQWNVNEEYNISQVTPDIPDGSDGTTPHTEGSRLIFVRGATGGQFVHINNHQIEMQDLDLYMRTDLVSKASDVVNETDVHHTSRPPNDGGFNDTRLGLVTSDTSLLMHPEQTDLEANAFVNSSSSQLPELVPQCLQSLDVSVSEAFQSQHTPQDPQHHSSLLQVREDQQHQHLQQHLDRQHHEHQQTQEQRSTDLLLTQTMGFDSSDTHPLTDQSVCHDHASRLALPEHQEHQPVSNDTPQASQSQLPSQGVLPISSFHLHENIMGTSSLNSKLTSVASESNNLRPDECDVSLSPSSTPLPFMPSNPPLQALSTADMMRSESTPVSISSGSKMVGFESSSSFGKAKKRKIAEKSGGDMVWLNSKSLESRQRDRHATQILIDIVSQPKWQEKLTSSTTKKKTVWREIGEEFSSQGYFLENPGKKCFQKWRNLERSFREYELSKKMLSSSVTKCLPDFYEELRPILKEKLSSSLDITCGDAKKGEGRGVANVQLMEKYIDFDSGPSVTFFKAREDLDPNRMPEPGQSCEADDRVQGSKHVESKGTVDCLDKPGSVFTTERENLLKAGGKQEQFVTVSHKVKNMPGHSESMTSLLEGLKSQQKDLAETNLALQSIKGLLEEQKKEREATNAESKQRFLELKAIIDKNQKEKMAFMFEFLKSFKQNHNNGEKS